MSVAQIWYALRDPDQGLQSIGPWHAMENGGGMFSHMSVLGYVLYYLLAILVVTFLNVALYSQIIAAMNGGQVSVARGFALASSKLPAIVAWSMLAGTIGVVVRLIQERSGYLMKGIAALAGLSWMAASVFVIPVIINEPRSRKPFDYLNISSTLLKRVWGEGIVGVSGVGLVFLLLFVPLFLFNFALTIIVGKTAITVLTVVIGVSVAMLLSLAYQIFECGLYVYATEGVAPGTFSEEFFDRVWTFKRGAIEGMEPKVARRPPQVWLWVAVPVAMSGASVLWLHSHFQPKPVPHTPPISIVSRITIDLANLDYSVSLKDFQAIGLFTGKTCVKCDFSSSGTWVWVGGKINDRLEADVARGRGLLYLGFFGERDADNQARAMAFVEALKARFPGHEEAFNLIDKIPYVPRTTVAAWNPLPTAASYTVELDCFHCCGRDKWCTDMGSKWKIASDLHATTYTFDWVGAQPGRWRVWATDQEGHTTKKSAWTYFDYSM